MLVTPLLVNLITIAARPATEWGGKSFVVRWPEWVISLDDRQVGAVGLVEILTDQEGVPWPICFVQMVDPGRELDCLCDEHDQSGSLLERVDSASANCGSTWLGWDVYGSRSTP